MMGCPGGYTFAARSVFILPFLIGAIGCSRTGDVSNPVKADSTVNREFQDAARFLAGLPSNPGSAYAELEKQAAWQSHAEGMNKAWAVAVERRVRPVQEFQNAELGGAAAKSDFVFYPFSGPDVVYAQTFYPNGNVYVLAGLERPGSILKPDAYKPETMEAQLDAVRRGSSSLLSRSFFVTGEMSRQMRGQLVDGVLPVMLMLLARMGNTVDNVRNVAIDEGGKLVDLPAPQAKPGEMPDGLEIVFHRDGERKQRKMYYFRVDLGAGLDKNASFLTFLGPFGRPETLIKSASFLLHWKTFLRIRDYILTNSTQIVQDDTGVRYDVFEKQHWRVRLYGKYGRPDNPFQKQFQERLDEAFQMPGRAKPLAFSMGYGTGRRPSHLIVAERP